MVCRLDLVKHWQLFYYVHISCIVEFVKQIKDYHVEHVHILWECETVALSHKFLVASMIKAWKTWIVQMEGKQNIFFLLNAKHLFNLPLLSLLLQVIVSVVLSFTPFSIMVRIFRSFGLVLLFTCSTKSPSLQEKIINIKQHYQFSYFRHSP